MLITSRAFVLRKILYNDTSIIVNAFLEDKGYISFIIQGARKPKAKLNAALFEIGNILELVYYYKENIALHKVKEARLLLIPQNTVTSMLRKAQVLFIADFVFKTMKNEHGNEQIFNLINTTVNAIENTSNPELSLHFAIQCMQYFGIYDEQIFENNFLEKALHHQIIFNNGNERKVLLDKILKYFVQHHFDEKLLQMQSVEILKMIL
jgi:DNA repair protein RecO (recombination protein O)